MEVLLLCVLIVVGVGHDHQVIAYDYLYLTIQWPRSFCNIQPNVFCSNVPNSFTIHGLWPRISVMIKLSFWYLFLIYFIILRYYSWIHDLSIRAYLKINFNFLFIFCMFGRVFTSLIIILWRIKFILNSYKPLIKFGINWSIEYQTKSFGRLNGLNMRFALPRLKMIIFGWLV